MIVVCDTGPLIALAKLDQLSLLRQVFSHVLIPPAVQRELLAKSGPESARLDNAMEDLIRVGPPGPLSPEVKLATQRLNIGEQQAVALAHQHQALLVIDDRLGRVAAQRMGLAVTGSVGVLLRAKEARLIPGVHPLLDEMRRSGYWLSDETVAIAVKLAGEG
jgi:predicted nucleic acid-binding protein